jgi:hypothetical protein
MKIIRLITIALLLTVTNTVLAQYDDKGYYQPGYGNRNFANNASYNNFYSDDEEGWGTIYASYSPMQLVSTAKGVDNKLFHTATIGFQYDFQLGESPAYFGAAFETSGAWFSKTYEDGEKYSMDLYYAKLPVNLSFRVNITEGLDFVPSAGVFVKWNISCREQEKYNGVTTTYNVFDSDYTYDDDYNRFQFGYQAGLNLIIANCLSVGAAWKADITSFCTYYDSFTRSEEKEKFRGISFSLGYCF